jgi:hypothetical protein
LTVRPWLASASLGLAAALVGRAAAAQSVWVVDDGEKIRQDATSTPFESGTENPVWRPGEPARLFAMKNETVALQVVVESDDAALEGVTVDLPELAEPGGARLSEGARPAAKGAFVRVGASIERFVEHFATVRRASGGKSPQRSPGWEPGSGPLAGEWVGPVPDALIPVDSAPAWDPYPMTIAPRSNGIVWIDLNVPRDQPAGLYRGAIAVRAAGRDVATIPVELEVVDAMLPDRTVATAVYYDPEQLQQRVGPRAESHLWKLLHAHRITPLHDATSPRDVDRQLQALSGALYTREQGYAGPAPGMGDGLLALGAHGAFGAPDEATLASVQSVTDRVSELKLLGSTEMILYAADDACSSPWGAGWSSLLRDSADASVRRLRVAWTCSQDPNAQPVDVPILHAAFDTAQAHAARARGKETWVRDGVLPRTGTFLLDADAVSPRVNGWLSAIYRVPRWFYWDATHWSASHGGEPLDPFVDTEHRSDEGDWANGDGVLLYPGTQRDAFDEHSIGIEGVLPSIRLQNWRRGIEDAGYLQMARERDAVRADAVARWLVPTAFGEARTGETASWSARGKAFFDARRALLAVVLGREPVALEERRASGGAPATPSADGGCSRGTTEAGGVVSLLIVAGAVGLGRRRRPFTGRDRRSRHAGGPLPRAAGGAGPT